MLTDSTNVSFIFNLSSDPVDAWRVCRGVQQYRCAMPCKQFTELDGVKIEVNEGEALVADLAAVGLTPWRDAFSSPNIEFRQQDDLGVESDEHGYSSGALL